jgi:predicted  nucleic acid-binding Zn-ribbon protein
MAKSKEMSVEEKLRALYDLQLIDSRIDTIQNLRGELPMEVDDLADEVEGLKTRLAKHQEDIETLNGEISARKNVIEEAKALIKKYAEQQKNVRNSREFNSLSKEVEFQELEIQLAEKHIKEFKVKIEQKNEFLEQTHEKLSERETHLGHKKSELDTILEETAKEEAALVKLSDEYKSNLDERLSQAYTRIRSSVANKLAVVSVERGASGGSFFTLPPQVQVEIASRKRVITDEHSGRILVDPTLAEEESSKMETIFKKLG